MRLVIDANVIVKCVFKEEFTYNALQILSNYDAVVPDILFMEIGNIIWKKCFFGNHLPEYADELFSKAENLINIIIPTKQLHHRTLQLSLELGHPFYDCLYLITALDVNAPLITADRKFYNKVVEHEVYSKFICWIENPPEVET